MKYIHKRSSFLWFFLSYIMFLWSKDALMNISFFSSSLFCNNSCNFEVTWNISVDVFSPFYLRLLLGHVWTESIPALPLILINNETLTQKSRWAMSRDANLWLQAVRFRAGLRGRQRNLTPVHYHVLTTFSQNTRYPGCTGKISQLETPRLRIWILHLKWSANFTNIPSKLPFPPPIASYPYKPTTHPTLALLSRIFLPLFTSLIRVKTQ